MAGQKKTVQAPIDRPLAKAYLRQFQGWSTAYPPGLSDPTSLRVMENVQITREGAARVRPARGRSIGAWMLFFAPAISAARLRAGAGRTSHCRRRPHCC